MRLATLHHTDRHPVIIRFLQLLSLFGLAGMLLTGCGGEGASSSPASAPASSAGASSAAKPKVEVKVYSAKGATFPAILYEKWFEEYKKVNPEVEFTYQALGSGAGVRTFSQGLVAFGTSDAAMTDEEIANVENGVVLLPMTAGSVVLAYNLPGVKELKLSRENLVAIFLGEITTWNDPKLAQDNPGLPDKPITVVRRAGSSGTTYAFTRHLSAISEAWKEKVGAGKSLQWPVGIAGKGNAGVAGKIKETPGGIGYVEYGFAIQNNMPAAQLQNQAGMFVAPNLESEQAALSNIQLPANLRAFDPDPAGEKSYPIVTFTWWLCYKNYDKSEEAKAVKALATWCVEEGQKYAEPLGYVPLPGDVRKKVLAALETIK